MAGMITSQRDADLALGLMLGELDALYRDLQSRGAAARYAIQRGDVAEADIARVQRFLSGYIEVMLFYARPHSGITLPMSLRGGPVGQMVSDFKSFLDAVERVR
jgi:hypothetical protein